MVAKLSIVVVEDNDDLRHLTCQVLAQDGHHVMGISCAEELEDVAGGESADIFLIDINLPGEDGMSLARRIRKAQPLVGIIMVSARSDIDDKIIGYDSGADFYITKPVVLSELSAAIRSFARKNQASKSKQFNPKQGLVLNKLEVTGPQGVVRLTTTEAMLLTAFARAPSGKLAAWQIAEMLDIEMDDSMKSSIAMRLARLRKKLSDAGVEGIVIESIRNFGYQILHDVELGY